MTYGSKRLPVALLMTLNYSSRACEDRAVAWFVYGSMDFRQGQPRGR